MAKEHDVKIDSLQGSGAGGRVTKQDVEKAVATEPPRAERREERRRMSKRRLTIARRLVEAQHNAAMLTTFNEVDMSEVMALRRRQKEDFERNHGVGLGIASFFVKATVAALRQFPLLNAEIQGEEIVLKQYYDIGIAVGAEGGLVVPVLRDADAMTFAQLEQSIRDFTRRAGEGNLTLEDLKGGTFTVTNGGVFGSLMSTPILNPPQVGILGLHKIQERAVPLDGKIVIRPMMYLALSYDHRLVDGREAVQFLVTIKKYIEDPGHLLLES
jgi:2-oxoglutarate dehydrogenase E2 component (dihydrolipoamide succinyltransferase)